MSVAGNSCQNLGQLCRRIRKGTAAASSFPATVESAGVVVLLVAMTACITAGKGNTVTKEAVKPTSGEYPEVGLVSGGLGCTGTIVGPYAVITAGHCVGTTNSFTDGTAMAASGAYQNPYRDRVPFAPQWWVNLNGPQVSSGRRLCDWPAMHDQLLLFVPNLTPAWLATNGIVDFPNLGASSAGDQFRIVGVGSTGGATRDWIAATMLAANADSIEKRPRDGYVNVDPATSVSDPGDSGGPLMLSSFFTSPTGKRLEGNRHLAGTDQDTTGSYAPLAYYAGMTANQRDTARRNSLWAAAQVDDIDNDGLPTECDENPSASGGANLCPAPVGIPVGPQVTSPNPPQSCSDSSGLAAWTGVSPQPMGLLACRAGFIATGLVGRGGDLVDELALQCSAISCFYGSGPCESYETDLFGGGGGSDYFDSCPPGQALTSFAGFQDANGLRSISAQCRSFDTVRSLPPTYSGSNLYIVGNQFGFLRTGTPYVGSCAKDRILTGLVVRSADARFVTGVQEICSAYPGGYSTYAGGKGGSGYGLSCPANYLLVGTAQRRASDGIDHFAILCAPRTQVEANMDIANGVMSLRTEPTVTRCRALFLGRRGPTQTMLLIDRRTPAKPDAQLVRRFTAQRFTPPSSSKVSLASRAVRSLRARQRRRFRPLQSHRATSGFCQFKNAQTGVSSTGPSSGPEIVWTGSLSTATGTIGRIRSTPSTSFVPDSEL